jgi:hypothetical protein
MSTKIDYGRAVRKEARIKRSFDKSHPDSLIDAVSYGAFYHSMLSLSYEAVSPNVIPGLGSRAVNVGLYINRLLADNGVEDFIDRGFVSHMSEADFRDGAERLLAWDMIRWFPRHKEIAEGIVSRRHGRKRQ